MAQPTSRKKYYLQIPIDPEWMTLNNFLSDLRDHIEGHSTQSLRDIFIAHSQRKGEFSVKTKQIADKLLSLFDTRNISCRGRKPKAEIIELCANKFQLSLSNINNIINASEFHSWVLSLNCDASDIELHPPQISSSSNTCILSFNTIDSAISVKQKLQNITFKDIPLYFTHWHVPRRINATNEVTKTGNTSKIGIVLGLIDNSSQSSGYSTGKSGTSSPITPGPLYLRDRSVPAPPRREPPLPPIEHEADVYSAYSPYPYISVQESRMSYEANMNYVTSLHDKLEEQALMIQQLMHKNKYIIYELDQQKSFAMNINTKYSALYTKYMSLYKLNKVLCWSVNDIIEWIMTLENGRFIKYKEYLIYSMNQQNINGSVLSKLNEIDLHGLGIIDVNDQCLLLNHIKYLIHTASKYN